MTIFDFISDILFTKKKNLFTVEDESEFSPYLVNRWISMYSNLTVNTCNILNKYLGIFESKRDLYNLFYNSFSRVPYKKISYFKRKKIEQDKNDNIPLIAAAKGLSQREIKDYIHTLQTINS